MADDDRPRASAERAQADALVELSRKLDTVAGALAAIASSHDELLSHVAEAEARRGHDAREVAQRLGALERQILALPSQAPAPPTDPLDPLPPSTVAAELDRLRADVSRSLEVLDQVDDRTQGLGERIAHHTDVALAGALRVIDDRLAPLRHALADAARSEVGGFEAGAVLGVTQAAWTRLDQRLDAEFDDLGRQLQAMVALIERTASMTEAMANRPVVTGDQIRRAASAMKESVASAGRSRRDRRGGPRGLGSGC